MEQIRIVREMRERDGKENGRAAHLRRPRFLIWENVTGAYSSNGGRDFQAVLTEIVKIADPETPDVPLPEKGWSKGGLIYDEMGKWSVAWRTHDSQYWGVPQRRKRICVLADLGGLAAGEILFDPQLERTAESGEPVSIERDSGNECRSEVQPLSESVSGNPEQSETEREDTAGDVGESTEAVVYGISSYDSNAMKSQNPESGIYEADTARTLDMRGGDPGCNQGGMIVLEGNGQRESHQGDGYKESETMYTLNTIEQHAVCYGLKTEPVSIEHHPHDSRVKIREDGTVQTLSKQMGTGGNNVPLVMVNDE